jgi:GT2 family glycosyltransferase
MDAPLISVAIVTWNRKDDVLTTIKSVYDQSYKNYEVVMVDNSSTDGTVDAVRQAYPDVRVVALERNLGPTGGRNAAIAAAHGEILFFLDSDASLGQDTLAITAEKFKAEQDLGVVACKVINAYTQQLDEVGGRIFSHGAEAEMEFFSYSFSECGCAIRKEVFERAGMFWDFLFFGREGEELGLRIWDAGYKILYSPHTVVYHRVSPNKRVTGGKREYFDLRNSLYVYLVRYPWWLLMGLAPLRLSASLVRGVRRGHLQQVLEAVLEVIRHLPYLWHVRRPISNETAYRYVRLQREHGPLSWDLVSWIKYKS